MEKIIEHLIEEIKKLETAKPSFIELATDWKEKREKQYIKQAKKEIICLIGSDNSDEIVIKFLEEYKDKMFWSRKQVLYAFHQWLVKRLQ